MSFYDFASQAERVPVERVGIDAVGAVPENPVHNFTPDASEEFPTAKMSGREKHLQRVSIEFGSRSGIRTLGLYLEIGLEFRGRRIIDGIKREAGIGTRERQAR